MLNVQKKLPLLSGDKWSKSDRDIVLSSCYLPICFHVFSPECNSQADILLLSYSSHPVSHVARILDSPLPAIKINRKFSFQLDMLSCRVPYKQKLSLPILRLWPKHYRKLGFTEEDQSKPSYFEYSLCLITMTFSDAYYWGTFTHDNFMKDMYGMFAPLSSFLCP